MVLTNSTPHAYYALMTSTKDSLLADVESFIASTGMSQTAFGVLSVNDRAFVIRLRGGMDPRSSTVDRVRSFMQSYRSGNRRPLGKRRASEPRSAA